MFQLQQLLLLLLLLAELAQHLPNVPAQMEAGSVGAASKHSVLHSSAEGSGAALQRTHDGSDLLSSRQVALHGSTRSRYTCISSFKPGELCKVRRI